VYIIRWSHDTVYYSTAYDICSMIDVYLIALTCSNLASVVHVTACSMCNDENIKKNNQHRGVFFENNMCKGMLLLQCVLLETHIIGFGRIPNEDPLCDLTFKRPRRKWRERPEVGRRYDLIRPTWQHVVQYTLYSNAILGYYYYIGYML